MQVVMVNGQNLLHMLEYIAIAILTVLLQPNIVFACFWLSVNQLILMKTFSVHFSFIAL